MAEITHNAELFCSDSVFVPHLDRLMTSETPQKVLEDLTFEISYLDVAKENLCEGLAG